MRISDWSSDVCSSDLSTLAIGSLTSLNACGAVTGGVAMGFPSSSLCSRLRIWVLVGTPASSALAPAVSRSEEHTSELQSLMRISYAVFCLQNKLDPDPLDVHALKRQSLMHIPYNANSM